MSIPFYCPHCGHFTQVEVRYAGQSGKCTACNKNITIPTPEQAAQDARKKPDSRPPTAVTKSDGHGKPAANRGVPKIKKRKNALLWLLVYASLAILIGAAALWLMLTTILAPRENAAVLGSGSCKSNLEQIGNAIESFYEAHGHFPCSKNRTSPEQSWHSWRVALLPYLSDKRLYESVKSRKNWEVKDSEFERARPLVYAASDDETLSELETSYFAIVGDQTGIVESSPQRTTQGRFQRWALADDSADRSSRTGSTLDRNGRSGRRENRLGHQR